MDLEVYLSGANDRKAMNALAEQFRALETGPSVRGIDLSESQEAGIRPEVLDVILLRRESSLPLTFADGHPVLSGRLPTIADVRQWLEHGVEGPSILVNRAESAVEFATSRRAHISLNARNVKISTAFYKVLFNQEPTKSRDDYTKFEVLEPPLNLALNEHDYGTRGESTNHFGIQVKTSEAVTEAKERFEAAGFPIEEEVETACCYAVQTKVWVADPDGNRWEVFLVTEAEADQGCGPDCVCYRELPRSLAGASTH